MRRNTDINLSPKDLSNIQANFRPSRKSMGGGFKMDTSWVDNVRDAVDIEENWGAGGLLGHYLTQRLLKSPKFNIDFPNSQLNWRPTEKLSLYARPDTLGEGKAPSGLKIGGSYNF